MGSETQDDFNIHGPCSEIPGSSASSTAGKKLEEERGERERQSVRERERERERRKEKELGRMTT
jgi:hypothetical protein